MIHRLTRSLLNGLQITSMTRPNSSGGNFNGAALAHHGSAEGDWSHRPAFVLERLRRKEPIYCFGLGSNMSRSHLESRSFDGKKIEVLSMEPALVRGFRLAFNLPTYLPLEPSMASLERCRPSQNPSGADDREKQEGGDGEGDDNPGLPLYPYVKDECHGALIRLSADDYERVMASESVSGTRYAVRDYQEVVVTAVPYDKSKEPIKAVALSVIPHVRLPQDVAPSDRYMQLLRDGARELGLVDSYQEFLNSHPVQVTPGWLAEVSLPNFVWTAQLYYTKTPLTMKIMRMQYRLLYLVYACPTSSPLRRWASHACQGLLLLPGAALGLGIAAYRAVTGTEHPVPVRMIVNRVRAHRRGNKEKI
jgi:hypothetical protein